MKRCHDSSDRKFPVTVNKDPQRKLLIHLIRFESSQIQTKQFTAVRPLFSGCAASSPAKQATDSFTELHFTHFLFATETYLVVSFLP